MTLFDLDTYDVVNFSEGRRIGKIVDVIVDTESATISDIIVELDDSKGGLVAPGRTIRIPWAEIKLFGQDVIFVDLKRERRPPTLEP